MTTLMRNGRDRRSGKPVMGHAILERALLVGTRSADHIRASGHSGCIATRRASTRKTGRIHGCTRTLRRKVRFLLHRGRRPYMAQSDRYCAATECPLSKVQRKSPPPRLLAEHPAYMLDPHFVRSSAGGSQIKLHPNTPRPRVRRAADANRFRMPRLLLRCRKR